MLQGILANMNGLRFTTAGARHKGGGTDPEPGPGDDGSEAGDYRLEALNRVLSSEHFRASARNKLFLKFVVEETVAGRAERIKAFTVAVDVFGRDSTFDASVDPIVRIAARHLRRSLDEYYATHGASDPVRISLPLGTYVPVFTKQQNASGRAIGRLSRLVADRQHRLQSGAVGVAMALAAASAALAYMSLGISVSPLPQKPVFVVDSARAHAEGTADDTFAHLFTQSLWIALSDEEAIRIVGVRPEEEFGEVLEKARDDFGHSTPLYQLLTAVRLDGSDLHVYWHVLDGRSNETYFSASTAAELEPGQRETAPRTIAHEVASSLNRLASGAIRPPSSNAATGDRLQKATPED